MDHNKPKIKIPWNDFIHYAIAGIKRTHTFGTGINEIQKQGETIKFIKVQPHERDSEVYDTPDYVEIDINLKTQENTHP